MVDGQNSIAKVFARLSSLTWRGIRHLYYWPGLVITHAVRLAKLRSDDWYRITAPWIINRPYPEPDVSVTKPRAWYSFRHHFTFGNEEARFNLDYAVRAGGVKGFALLYAMGAGDYFFTTPLLQALRERYPHLPIIAFATKNAGEVNSPLIGELLSYNPHIKEVLNFNGRQTRRFKNYDYSDAVRQTPDGYPAIPVFSDHSPATRHRVVALFETFGLPAPTIVPPPLIHLPPSPPPHVILLLEKIKQECARNGVRGVAFLQVDSRSSHYMYPYPDKLAEGLIERGYYVVSASKLNNPPKLSHVLDFNQFAIMDSVYLLKLLREAFADMQIVSVASVFWSVSSGLGIPNLGMQHFSDHAMHNYWYPNITVITHRDYEKLPPNARFLARPGDYQLDSNQRAVFAPSFVLECFDFMRNGGRHGSDQESLAEPVRAATVS